MMMMMMMRVVGMVMGGCWTLGLDPDTWSRVLPK